MSAFDDREIALALMLRAVNAGDAAPYASVYARTATLTIHGVGVLSGRDAIEAHEAELLREFPGARLAFESIWHARDATVVHYAVNASSASGKLIGNRGLLFLRFDAGGLIERETRYVDSFTPLAQLGLRGESRARPAPRLALEPVRYRSRETALEAANVAVVSSMCAEFDAGNESLFLQRFTDGAVIDELTYSDPATGQADLKSWFRIWRCALPDVTTRVTAILGVADHVLAETVVRGTHRLGLGGVRASHTRIEIHRAVSVRLRAGQIAHIVGFMNGKEIEQAAGSSSIPTHG